MKSFAILKPVVFEISTDCMVFNQEIDNNKYWPIPIVHAFLAEQKYKKTPLVIVQKNCQNCCTFTTVNKRTTFKKSNQVSSSSSILYYFHKLYLDSDNSVGWILWFWLTNRYLRTRILLKTTKNPCYYFD